MLYIVLLVVCVVLAVFFYKNNVNKDYWRKQNIVQVNDLLKVFSSGSRSLAEVYKEVYDNYPEEPCVGSFLGSKTILIVRDLKNVQSVLANDFESFSSRGILTNENDILADNVLFLSNHDRWKLIRQKLSPVFTVSKLKNMSYIIERTARDFTDMIKKHSDMRKTPFKAIFTYTTASIGASVFGIDTQMGSTMDSPFLEMSFNTLKPSFMTTLRFFIGNFSPALYKLLRLKLFGEYEDFFIGAVKNVLKSRRSQGRPVHDFIDICLEIQKAGTMRDPTTGYECEPTDEVLAAQAFFFFIAGADTSANAMHFTLLELSSQPEVLKRLHEEIDKVFEENDDNINYEAIEKLKYLDMVVNEAMRMYPPIGLMQRECTKDTVLPAGNVKIKKGGLVVVPVYAIHRDEKYYPNPDVFDPERFAPGKSAQIPKYAKLSFGEGKRICLGARYACLQVKSGLAFLLREFTLRHQNYDPKSFEKSTFALRDPDTKYELVPREYRRQ